jgi:hypothetical protein
MLWRNNQIPNTNNQNFPLPTGERVGVRGVSVIWTLVFGVYLGFWICDLGFGILNYITPSRGIKHAIREKRFPPE